MKYLIAGCYYMSEFSSLILLCIMFKNDQTYFKYLASWAPQDFLKYVLSLLALCMNGLKSCVWVSATALNCKLWAIVEESITCEKSEELSFLMLRAWRNILKSPVTFLWQRTFQGVIIRKSNFKRNDWINKEKGERYPKDNSKF